MRGADKRDALHGAVAYALRDPFGAGAGFAAAASAHEEPDAPVSRRRELLLPRPEIPVFDKRAHFIVFQSFNEISSRVRRQRAYRACVPMLFWRLHFWSHSFLCGAFRVPLPIA